MGGAAVNRWILVLPGRLAGRGDEMSLGSVSGHYGTNPKAPRWESPGYASGEEEREDVGPGPSGEDPDHRWVDFRARGRTDGTRSPFRAMTLVMRGQEGIRRSEGWMQTGIGK